MGGKGGVHSILVRRQCFISHRNKYGNFVNSLPLNLDFVMNQKVHSLVTTLNLVSLEKEVKDKQ